MLKPSKELMAIFAILVGVWGALLFSAAAIPLLNLYLYSRSHPPAPGTSGGSMTFGNFLGAAFSSWMGLAAGILYVYFGVRSLLGHVPSGLGYWVACLDLAARIVFLFQFSAVIFKVQPTVSQNLSLILVVALPFFLSGLYSAQLFLWLRKFPENF